MKQRVVIIIGAVVAVILVAAWALLLYKPQSDKLAQVQRQVEAEKAQESALQAQLVKLNDLKEQEPEIDLEMTGKYFTIVDYLTRVQELSRAVRFDTIQLSVGANEDGSPGALSVKVSGRMFSAGGGAPAPNAAAGAPAAGARPEGTNAA